MFAEYKTVSAVGGTKRRKYVSTVPASQSALSNRVTKLARSLKANNPTHLNVYSLPGQFPTIATTGSLLDLAQNIAQGDDYTNRVSSSCILTHVNLKGVLIAGTAATTTVSVRITIFKAIAGIAFASNMTGSYSPIVTGTSLKLMYDRFYPVAAMPAAGSQGFSTVVNISQKLRHKQKFTGTGAATQTGDSIFVVIQGGTAAGTGAPTFVSGVLEVFFQPT